MLQYLARSHSNRVRRCLRHTKKNLLQVFFQLGILRLSCKGIWSKNGRQNLLVRQIVFLDLVRHSFVPAGTSKSVLHRNGNDSKFSMKYFGRNLSFFLARRPNFLVVIARSRLASLFWHAFSGESLFCVRLPFCPRKAPKPESSAPWMVALKTLHMNLKSTCAFQNWPIMCHASQAEAILVSLSVANVMFQADRLPRLPHLRL